MLSAAINKFGLQFYRNLVDGYFSLLCSLLRNLFEIDLDRCNWLPPEYNFDKCWHIESFMVLILEWTRAVFINLIFINNFLK